MEIPVFQQPGGVVLKYPKSLNFSVKIPWKPAEEPRNQGIMLRTILLLTLTLLGACATEQAPSSHQELQMTLAAEGFPTPDASGKVRLSDADWAERLTEEQFRVTRKAGTERAFTGTYWDEKRDGVYRCVNCGLGLFDASTKYASGTGWPSFWEPLAADSVEERDDHGLFSTRTEILCNRCEAHLGHVFPDGPRPTGLRYCMNSAALVLQTDEPDTKKTSDR